MYFLTQPDSSRKEKPSIMHQIKGLGTFYERPTKSKNSYKNRGTKTFEEK